VKNLTEIEDELIVIALSNKLIITGSIHKAIYEIENNALN
jgi:hypothetical protein